jgi:small subunit ribosomal protein S9
MAQKPVITVGRRKTSNARVVIRPLKLNDQNQKEEEQSSEGELNIVVNGKHFRKYFPRATSQMLVARPLVITERGSKYSFEVNSSGGGLSGQVGAVVHGIARALQKLEPELRPVLKKAGLLTRDPRAVERKKPGRHKARKRPQFSKR